MTDDKITEILVELATIRQQLVQLQKRLEDQINGQHDLEIKSHEVQMRVREGEHRMDSAGNAFERHANDLQQVRDDLKILQSEVEEIQDILQRENKARWWQHDLAKPAGIVVLATAIGLSNEQVKDLAAKLLAMIFSR